MNEEQKKTKILIVGGGFGGIKAALELCHDKRVAITLLSDHSHFRYYPALYHAATGGKRAGSRIRLQDILWDRPITFERGEAVKLDRDQKQVETAEGKRFSYDSLILALGNETNYFGIKGLAEHSFGIKSTEEVEKLKAHLSHQFIKNGCPDLNYVIVGGGPTGIELAGSLPNYLRRLMKKHGVKECPLHVHLVEAAPRLLPRMPESVSAAVTKRLEALGITLHIGQAVEGATSEALMIADKPLPSRTVIWTAGVSNNPFFKANDFKLNERGKVIVDEFLQAEPHVYVLGDNANTQYSGMAQTALYDGEFVAANLHRQLTGGAPRSYTPEKPITVIPVGKNWASVQWGPLIFNGWIGGILRYLADLLAFHDLESWPRAGKQWLRSMDDDEDDPPLPPAETPHSRTR